MNLSDIPSNINATFKLREDVKRDWLAALRSGNYKQGENTMFCSNNNSYCCLGVLCEILGKTSDELNGKEMPEDVGIGTNLRKRIVKKLYLPEGMQWGVRDDAGRFVQLSILNDTGSSFKDIADLIESNVETY